MKPARHPTALRTAQLLLDAGIDTHVVEFEQPTRTSAEAASAIGCSIAEIAKSIVFRGIESGQAVVVVASGDNRVSESKVAGKVNETLARADAEAGSAPEPDRGRLGRRRAMSFSRGATGARQVCAATPAHSTVTP